MTEKPPSIDQDGKMINPHNPEFITKVPWYLGNHGPTLKHHNIQKSDHILTLTETDELVSRKLEAQQLARHTAQKTVYKKGACKNCGAMTHKEKDCMERPRSLKKTAWKTGIDISADDVILKMENYGKMSYAAKRDSWTGYDAKEYQEVLKRHEQLEEERRKEILKQKENQEERQRLRAQEKAEKHDQVRDFQDTMVPQGGLGGAGMRQTVRNLRIREDTPKYLRNLSLDSAFYDPKSRSMRSNPYPNANPEDLPFAGDNFVRYSGDAVKLAQNQILCWEMQARGENVDVISNPSQAEFLHRIVAEKKKNAESEKRKEILEKYLDGKEQPSLDPRLRLGQTEAYLEYSRDGRVIKGVVVEPPVVKTKYEEDVYPNNHTSVWGSYYNRLVSAWGYACCHSLIRNSYCTGEKGKEANDTAQTATSLDSFQLQRMLEKNNAQANTASNSSKAMAPPPSTDRSALYGDGSAALAKNLDEKKVQEALKRANDHQDNEVEVNGGSKKRSYNSMQAVDVTAEDLEAYRRRKAHTDDPMANYVDKEEL
eukprot:gene5136-5643_t